MGFGNYLPQFLFLLLLHRDFREPTFRLWGLRLRVQGSGFGFWGLGFTKIQDLAKLRVDQSVGFKVQQSRYFTSGAVSNDEYS